MALEGLAQICSVAFEVAVAPIIRFRGNWLVDATAVSMLFIAVFGRFVRRILKCIPFLYRNQIP